MTTKIGSPAIDRPDAENNAVTIIQLANPSTVKGFITHLEVQALSGFSLTNWAVGTFYLVSGTTFHCRDSNLLVDDNVPGGSKQPYDVDKAGNPLHIAVQPGDYIGSYYTSGYMELSQSGGVGVYKTASKKITPGEEAVYVLTAGDDESLEGTITAIPGGGGPPIMSLFGEWR